VALGSTAPEGSVIVPRMFPETEALCAKTEEEKTSKQRMNPTRMASFINPPYRAFT
jgi:hypothetical protein